MIGKEEFINLITEYYKQYNRVADLNKIFPALDSPIIDYGWKMFEKVIEAHFTKEGIDWIYWWLYEKNCNQNIKAWDEDHNEIPTETFDDIWNLIKNCQK